MIQDQKSHKSYKRIQIWEKICPYERYLFTHTQIKNPF